MPDRYYWACGHLAWRGPSDAHRVKGARQGDGEGDVGGAELTTYDDPVEYVAREIQLVRHDSVPAMMFLEASRPYRALGSAAMLFFDPVSAHDLRQRL